MTTYGIVMYKDCDIPAKLFFKVINTSDYTLLGEGTPEEQEQAFNDIFDEYYILDGNKQVEASFKKSNRLALLRMNKSFIDSILHAITFVPMTKEERIELIQTLNSTELIKPPFNVDKPILDEIKRVQIKSKAIGNLIRYELSGEKKTDTNVKSSFEKEVVSIENILGRGIENNDLTLRKYVELKKSAIEKVNNQKKQQKNGK